MAVQRWKIIVEYNGSLFYGWQRQEDSLQTVQGTVEQAITKFCQQKITVQCAGRTDAGVHALGQVAHFDLDYGDRKLEPYDLAKALNAHLRNKGVVIINAEKVGDDFHARFSAKHKLYRYRVLCRQAPPTLDDKKIWHVWNNLDIDAMRAAAEHLIGYHDFTSFRDSDCQAKSPMRTLDKITITEKPYDHTGGIEINFDFEAQSFLHHQVRNMVGTLTLVGKGKWSPDDVKRALDAKNRTKGGPTAPADGLLLVRISYD